MAYDASIPDIIDQDSSVHPSAGNRVIQNDNGWEKMDISMAEIEQICTRLGG